MNYVNAVIEDKAAFDRELDTAQPVFTVFLSDDCRACRDALPRFMRISERYKHHVKILILDCAETPRHPSVDRIPMLLIYHNHVLLEALPGLGEQALERAFEQYTRLPVVMSEATLPGKPASPAVPPPPPLSGATPHGPGYRPPLASGREGSSPARPGSGSPR